MRIWIGGLEFIPMEFAPEVGMLVGERKALYDNTYDIFMTYWRGEHPQPVTCHVVTEERDWWARGAIMNVAPRARSELMIRVEVQMILPYHRSEPNRTDLLNAPPDRLASSTHLTDRGWHKTQLERLYRGKQSESRRESRRKEEG